MILDVYVMNKNGICLCRRSYGKISESEENVDDLLLTGFMSALLSFTEQMGEARLEVVKTNKYLLACNTSDPIAVIVIASGEREEVVKEVAKEILKRFKGLYAHLLNDWDGNIEYFQAFGEEIDYVVKKMKKTNIRELIKTNEMDAKEIAEIIISEINQQLQKIMAKNV
ncbi:MAG: hypothetical protein QXX87_04815 [Candidatus Jordarchaeales archaeon]